MFDVTYVEIGEKPSLLFTIFDLIKAVMKDMRWLPFVCQTVFRILETAYCQDSHLDTKLARPA